jgi:hypothetical protein
LEESEVLVVDFSGSLLDTNLICLVPLRGLDAAVFWLVELEIGYQQACS